ncbi:alpha-L-fucosidase [Planctomycetes bacterium K23_9]|uniref:Alpha-L-fucosidase n=1 Tax=Stieleria marina TaxID=1930275 RepID=A0A517NMF9_9BACT|nr:Alpha-L-fucosidase [Planctomycetes bacterium K23_9]
MKNQHMVLYRFLFSISLLAFLPVAAFAQHADVHSYWAPRTWQLRADDITTIMGFLAQLSGNLAHADRPTPTVVNDAFVRGFQTENDVMTWEVNAPDEASYSVSLRYAGREEILAQSTLEVSSSGTTIREKVNVPNWDTRPLVQTHTLKRTLLLKTGINKISLRLVDFQGTQDERDALDNMKNARGKTAPFSLWSIELVRPEALVAMKARAKAMKADVQWMVDGKYGLFVHFSSGRSNGGEYQQRVDSFDVDAFVEKVVEIGASWVCFTCSHGAHFWPGPSKSIDQLKPGFTCQRDLIRELIDALGKHDIRLMLYYNPNSGMQELYGNTYGSGTEPDPTGYFNFLESHFREVSLRYGEDLATTAGYIDDCGWKLYQLDPPWEKFAKAIKAGNPNAPVGFSQNLFANLTPFSDFVVSDGAGREPEHYADFLFEEGGQLEGQTTAAWFYMDGWSGGARNGVWRGKPKFSAEKYIEIFKKADEANMPVTINLSSSAYITRDAPFFNPACIDIMKKVREAVKGN